MTLAAHRRNRVPLPEPETASFAGDVRWYLSQRPRQLPSRYLYDALGSALFDAICELPWYRVTVAENRLLGAAASAILGGPDRPSTLVELGSGNGSKLAALIGAGLSEGEPVSVHLVDVSQAALAVAERSLTARSGTKVVGHLASYEAGLERVGLHARPGPTLLLFLGSNIGNFDPDGARDLLDRIRRALAPGDRLLLGVDLVKPEADLLLAYDDPLQVTAAFNRNLLVRINRELDADFDLNGFTHVAVWNGEHSRIEMHLESLRPQRVRIRRAGFETTFRTGERIWTESSYKYTPEGIGRLLAGSGFGTRRQWIDERDGFALTLAER